MAQGELARSGFTIILKDIHFEIVGAEEIQKKTQHFKMRTYRLMPMNPLHWNRHLVSCTAASMLKCFNLQHQRQCSKINFKPA